MRRVLPRRRSTVPGQRVVAGVQKYAAEPVRGRSRVFKRQRQSWRLHSNSNADPDRHADFDCRTGTSPSRRLAWIRGDSSPPARARRSRPHTSSIDRLLQCQARWSAIGRIARGLLPASALNVDYAVLREGPGRRRSASPSHRHICHPVDPRARAEAGRAIDLDVPRSQCRIRPSGRHGTAIATYCNGTVSI